MGFSYREKSCQRSVLHRCSPRWLRNAQFYAAFGVSQWGLCRSLFLRGSIAPRRPAARRPIRGPRGGAAAERHDREVRLRLR